MNDSVIRVSVPTRLHGHTLIPLCTKWLHRGSSLCGPWSRAKLVLGRQGSPVVTTSAGRLMCASLCRVARPADDAALDAHAEEGEECGVRPGCDVVALTCRESVERLRCDVGDGSAALLTAAASLLRCAWALPPQAISWAALRSARAEVGPALTALRSPCRWRLSSATGGSAGGTTVERVLHAALQARLGYWCSPWLGGQWVQSLAAAVNDVLPCERVRILPGRSRRDVGARARVNALLLPWRTHDRTRVALGRGPGALVVLDCDAFPPPPAGTPVLSVADVERSVARHRRGVRAKVAQLKQCGVSAVIVCQSAAHASEPDPSSVALMQRLGVALFVGVPRSDAQRLAEATGATMVRDPSVLNGHALKSVLGRYTAMHWEAEGDVEGSVGHERAQRLGRDGWGDWLVLCPLPTPGARSGVLLLPWIHSEAEALELRDAVACALRLGRALMAEPWAVPGGGATAVWFAHWLRTKWLEDGQELLGARELCGGVQEAMEAIPTAILATGLPGASYATWVHRMQPRADAGLKQVRLGPLPTPGASPLGDACGADAVWDGECVWRRVLDSAFVCLEQGMRLSYSVHGV